MANAATIERAKQTAMAKVQGWAKVQTAARAKKLEAREAGNVALERVYLDAEFKASARRSRHEQALVAIDRMERDAAELKAWNQKKA